MSNIQPAAQGTKETGLRVPSNGKTIYHRPLNRTKTAELSQASFAYLFSEMVTYAQRRVKGIQELEQRYVRPNPQPTVMSRKKKGTKGNEWPTKTSFNLGSTNKDTPSASSSSTSSSTASRRARSCAPSASSPYYTSSSRMCGSTCLAGRRTGWKSPTTPTRPTST